MIFFICLGNFRYYIEKITIPNDSPLTYFLYLRSNVYTLYSSFIYIFFLLSIFTHIPL